MTCNIQLFTWYNYQTLKIVIACDSAFSA